MPVFKLRQLKTYLFQQGGENCAKPSGAVVTVKQFWHCVQMFTYLRTLSVLIAKCNYDTGISSFMLAAARVWSVDGSWCSWSEWSSCDDDVELQIRSRNCSCPPAINGGSQCSGQSDETISNTLCVRLFPVDPQASVARWRRG